MAYYDRKIVPLGTRTRLGEVIGVCLRDGERHYFLRDLGGIVSLFPADVVEREAEAREAARG